MQQIRLLHFQTTKTISEKSIITRFAKNLVQVPVVQSDILNGVIFILQSMEKRFFLRIRFVFELQYLQWPLGKISTAHYIASAVSSTSKKRTLSSGALVSVCVTAAQSSGYIQRD